MNNENSNKNRFNNILIVVAVLCVIGVLVLYFIINKDDKSSIDLSLDESSLNKALVYLGIGSDGVPNDFNDDIVRKTITGDKYNPYDLINEYARVNNLFNAEEYLNDNVAGCEYDNDQVIIQECYLLSREKFDMIVNLYNLNVTFDNVDVKNKVEDSYLYRHRIAVAGNHSLFKYNINSALFTDENKNSIVIDATREVTSIFDNSTEYENYKFYLSVNENGYLLENVELINN